MRSKILSIDGFRLLIVLSLITALDTGRAQTIESDSDSEANSEVNGIVEYKLPDEIGVLTFKVPLHWEGARAEDVDALWIDQSGSPFKDNVTLKIRTVDKVSDADQLLDYYMKQLTKIVEANSISDIWKAKGRRSVTFERTVSGHDIKQHVVVIYAESSEKSYLLSLNNSHLATGNPINLSLIKIN